MSFLVTDRQKDPNGQIIHRLELNKEATKVHFDPTSLPKHLKVKASVYLERRRNIQRHYSATQSFSPSTQGAPIVSNCQAYRL
jgi:alanyl-tRNA synthetase